MFLSINYIAYLTTLQGEHRVFMIAIRTCKCAILILGILRFIISHRYLYALLFFLFVKYEIQNNAGWLLVIVIHQFNRLVWYGANTNGTVGFISLTLCVTYYLFFMPETFTTQKYRKTTSSHYFVVPDEIFWTVGRFEGSADCF